MKIREMNVSCIEGFRVLSEEEMNQMNFINGAPDLCILDPEKHILMNFASSKGNILISAMLSERDVARQTEKIIAQAMRESGFEFIDFVSEEISGREAEGFLYEYKADDIDMSGKVLCLKKAKAFYFIYCYYRKALEKESLETIRRVFDTISWD